MTPARLRSGLAHILRMEILFGAGFTIGGIYVACLMTFPRLLAIAVRLL